MLESAGCLVDEWDNLEEASGKRQLANNHVMLVAKMYGMVTFKEPTNTSTKLSNDQVCQLFGHQWMERPFRDHSSAINTYRNWSNHQIKTGGVKDQVSRLATQATATQAASTQLGLWVMLVLFLSK
jgi:hypothetical protein